MKNEYNDYVSLFLRQQYRVFIMYVRLFLYLKV